MVLVDASGLIDQVIREEGNPLVERVIADEACGVTTANLAEVYDICQRVYQVPADAIAGALDPLLDSALAILPLSRSLAIKAGTIRATNYSRREGDISLADCVLLASAEPGDSIATADRVVLDVASAGGLETIDLS